MKPQSVFVLSAGEYSDWHIIAIYSTKAGAKKAKRRYNKEYTNACWGYDAQVAERPLDEPIESIYRHWCRRYDTGKVLFGEESGNPNTAPKIHSMNPGWCVVGYGITREHSRRSVDQFLREKRALKEELTCSSS